MMAEAALITASCVLFVQMGLSEAIQETLGFRSKILSCPKCLTFWTCLAWTVFHGYGALPSVAASFISSYCALWLALVYDALAVLYSYCYENITKTPGASEEPEAGSDEVPQMQQIKL